MLVETPYKKGDIITFKTAYGQEVVGKLENEDGSSITVGKPLSLVVTAEGLQLAPFLLTVDAGATVKLNNQTFLCVNKTVKAIADKYIKHTSDSTP
jgi:hypothetical protein